MQLFIADHRIKTASLLLIALLIAGFANPSQAITPDQASEQVKSLPCKDNMSVDQILDQSIKSHSQRDIGWRTFQEDGYLDIERAILVNKGMELRYRWRVQWDGAIAAENERALKLCSAG